LKSGAETFRKAKRKKGIRGRLEDRTITLGRIFGGGGRPKKDQGRVKYRKEARGGRRRKRLG